MASPELLAAWTKMLLRLVAEDAEHAIERGAGADPAFIVSRAHFAVDAAGRERVEQEILDFYDRLAVLEEELRVAEDDVAADGLNVALVVHRGRREAGRNGPVFNQMGSTRLTIPPD
jgi:hypothetical protein